LRLRRVSVAGQSSFVQPASGSRIEESPLAARFPVYGLANAASESDGHVWNDQSSMRNAAGEMVRAASLFILPSRRRASVIAGQNWRYSPAAKVTEAVARILDGHTRAQ
jgi:hypothetical protein